MYDLIFADSEGRFYDHPELKMVGRIGEIFVEPVAKEMIPLPEGASLVLLPDRIPVGLDAKGNFTLAKGEGRPMWAVGALLPQGYTRTLVPAYKPVTDSYLPLFGYAAVGWQDGTVYVAAYPTDDPYKWDPVNYNTEDLAGKIAQKLARHKNNRILDQLAKCALHYSCFTAQNIFYERWEGGIPVSPRCNARCLGCISEQPAECCPSPQTRISFTPTVKEIEEIAYEHLVKADDAIVSFGQGCEGEPALAYQVIAEAIGRIRDRTGLGTINMNTNGGFTEGVKAVCKAGIDSLRISTVSALEETYNAYYRPRNYSLTDVKKSIAIAKEEKVFVALNLLTYPGLTDREKEVEALIDLVDEFGIDMIQFRNLNIDPLMLAQAIPPGEPQTMGIPDLIECLREEFPDLLIGSFSKPVRSRFLK
ncbi:radical SAM protein [Thermincola ferriacetica]|uniref:Radical SAM domain protein n=2 Tax=Thermincola TaxID=278993 RepID=D5XDJ4_THEPJ|nr:MULTISPECIES: radical SAM protein [Thermincola]ADG83740.1 Radical SAM domain protein [Thermincola potens JR]KNZ68391.1 radical SAM protein [Thermincola ferriacetica]